ncbi:MAG: TlpA family protein disulfide reductase [Proteobacteria bacterium]|nr:TlpA family protein disulfide reductase [Pseudomonadota bacterium]
MTKQQITAIAVSAVIALALGIATGFYAKRWFQGQDAAERRETAEVARPDSLPKFVLYDLDGNEVSKDDLLANDKALFINFWATWCKPCREEMPLLSEMQEKYSDRLLMVGIAIDNKEAVVGFLEQLGGVDYPILLGKQELDAIETANDMGIELIGLPISLTTDRSGKIVRIHTGEVDEAEVTALIEEAVQANARD